MTAPKDWAGWVVCKGGRNTIQSSLVKNEREMKKNSLRRHPHTHPRATNFADNGIDAIFHNIHHDMMLCPTHRWLSKSIHCAVSSLPGDWKQSHAKGLSHRQHIN